MLCFLAMCGQCVESESGALSALCVWVLLSFEFGLWVFCFAVHPLELGGDLHCRFVSGLRHVVPHEHSCAKAEREEDEEAEIFQMFLCWWKKNIREKNVMRKTRHHLSIHPPSTPYIQLHLRGLLG